MAATAEATTVRVLSDENVGSHMISAPMETWKDTVQALRDSGNVTTADAVTELLRSSSPNPTPGDTIDIELMPSTETEAQLAAVIEAFSSAEAEIEYGDYSRKTQTARKSSATKSSGGRAAGSKSKKGTPRECECGCGDMTGGGTFRPGHDARFKGNMLKLIDKGGPEGEAALERLSKFPNLYDITQARDRLGSGPAKEAAKRERLERLKAEKEAAKNANTEGEGDAEAETK